MSSSAQTLQWIARPFEFLRNCAKEFGEVFALDFGAQGHYVVFSNPETLRQIFTAPADVLHVGPGNAVLEPLVGPTSLLLLEEERHLRERRILLPHFQQKAVGQYARIIQDAVANATADWCAGSEFDAQVLLQDVSIDVILRAVFGLELPEEWSELKSALVSLLNDRRLGMGVLGRLREAASDPVLEDFRRRLTRLREVTKALIVSRRSAPRPEDPAAITALLAATDEHGAPRRDDEICDELLTLVVTGHETTATALAWGLYWIATHPPVEQRLRDEIQSTGAHDSKAVQSLGYLDAVCKEILRIYPIVPSVFRQVVKPFAVSGFEFRPGVVMSPSIYLVHHREDLYLDSSVFNPDRFLARTFSPYEYLPFGGGARRCVGMHLALFEMKLVLAGLLLRYQFALTSAEPVVPVRRMVAIAPSGGPRVAVKAVL